MDAAKHPPYLKGLISTLRNKMRNILRYGFPVSCKINKMQMPFFATLQRMSLQSEKGFTVKLFYVRVDVAEVEKWLRGERRRLGQAGPAACAACQVTSLLAHSLTHSFTLSIWTSGPWGRRHFQATQTVQANWLANWLCKPHLKAPGHCCWSDSLI